MMLINHISNMHSNRFLKITIFFPLFFKISKLVQVGESRWIIEYSPFPTYVALKCTCKFSMFKYYNRIHQTSNKKYV
jgi:hypothetical protein